MKKIFKIDGGLYPLGLFAILSGMGLHMAGHGGNHHTWEIWAVVHSVTAVSLTLLIACHIQTHWAWFNHLHQRAVNHKRFLTTMLTAVTVLAVFSGIALLAIWGTNTHIGHWHYATGIVWALLILIHGVKRIRIIKKAISVKHIII